MVAPEEVNALYADALHTFLGAEAHRVVFGGPVPGEKDMFAVMVQHGVGFTMCWLFSAARADALLAQMHDALDGAFAARELDNTVEVDVERKRRQHSVAGPEVVADQPWFVGTASKAEVEAALETGMVGDFVVRESASTPGAYVLVIKLSATEFIQEKIVKSPAGYVMNGRGPAHPSVDALIRTDVRAKRPAKGNLEGAGGGDRRASASSEPTDIRIFDGMYLGYQRIHGRKLTTADVGRTLVKESVVENSKARQALNAAVSSGRRGSMAASHQVARGQTAVGTVFAQNPCVIVVSPQLVQVVERQTGEVLHKIFVQRIPFTLEAPGRDEAFEKFTFLVHDSSGSLECHIFNVAKGMGTDLADAISFYIREAAKKYSEANIKAHDPFAAVSGRESAPASLFRKQVHRADMRAIKVIGAGQFGEVWLAEQRGKTKSGQPVVVKRAVKMLKGEASSADRKEFVREAEVMLNFDHDNVTRIIGVCVQQAPWLTILEFMPYGDLKDVFRSCQTKGIEVTPGEVLDLATQLCRGCGYVVSLRLVHMDIAARNCLLGAEGRVKLADFGLTRKMDAGTDSYRLKEKLSISIKWAALEALERKYFNEKSDVWSFGVAVWEMFTYGEIPYRRVPVTQTVPKLKAGLRLEQPPNCPADIWAILARTWATDPADRDTFAALEAKLGDVQPLYPIAQPRRDIGKVNAEAKARGR